MSLIEVCLKLRDGSEQRIERPLHFVGGKPAITYKGRKWPIDSNGRLDLRRTKPFAETVAARAASPLEAAKFKRVGPKLTASAVISSLVSTAVSPRQPATPRLDPSDADFDESQRDAITTPATDRLLVDAGPGTGKTAVACARVSWLAVSAEIPPSQIWLISFTRTAVQEIRSRLRKLIGDPMIARAVQVGTLDSIAWQINKGYNSGAKLTGSFDDNIRALHGQLADNEPVRNSLSGLCHLIIDEAQDIVGPRADLLLALIRILPSSCGVTIFADEAQAIYGFAEPEYGEKHSGGERALPLSARIRAGELGRSFRECVLTQVHRTSDPELLRLFTDVRSAVLASTNDPVRRNTEIRDAIRASCHGRSANNVDAIFQSLPRDSFVLYRRRGDALMASSMLHGKGISHRIRMSGLPATIPPWIAATLSEVTEPRLDLRGFEDLWMGHAEPVPQIRGNTTVSDAWRLLLDTAADKSGRLLDLRLLRDRLAVRPPASLVRSELGDAGPIVGTIHAAKGREADVVHLMLPGEPASSAAEADDVDEETRILFVGATRAREQLFIGRGFDMRMARIIGSGRVYRFFPKDDRPMCSVEIGINGDLTPNGLAGREFFASASAARSAQAAWIEAARGQKSVVVLAEQIGDAWRMAARIENIGKNLAILESRVNEDLWELAKFGTDFFGLRGTPRSATMLPYLHLMGFTTMAVRSSEAALLHDPWKKSGLILAPLLYGFCPFTVRTV